MNKHIFWSGTLLLGSLSGCAQIEDCIDDKMMSCRDQWAAKAAWQGLEHCYATVDYQSDFKDGFEAGYENVAEGGTGCLPALPPRKYWKVFYQTPAGRAMANAWFEGFAHGALAADQDGIESLNGLPVNPGLVQQIRERREAHSSTPLEPVPQQPAMPPAPEAVPEARRPIQRVDFETQSVSVDEVEQ